MNILPVILVVSLIPVVIHSCIPLLTGWEPMPITERAKLAEIVMSAKTLKTFKDNRETESSTYSATFKVINILKGFDLLTDTPALRPGVYNVSNFGDKVMCFADVEEGTEYILFLTVFGDHLSAKYDDLFGAIDQYSEDNEDRILQSLGWLSWNDWGSCTTFCGGGTQIRVRDCQSDQVCDGPKVQSRKCNMFKCHNITDMLSIINKQPLPQGVQRPQLRPSAFHISDTAKLHATTRNVFQEPFPKEFSVLLTFKQDTGNVGYIMTIHDLFGIILIGIKISNSDISFVYNLGYKDLKDSVYVFKTEFNQTEWSYVSFSIGKKYIMMYHDCRLVDRYKIKHTKDVTSSGIGLDTVVSIGKTFFENEDYPSFVGGIEQLLVIPGTQAARQQCHHNIAYVTGEPELNDSSGLQPQATNGYTGLQGITDTTTEVVLSWSAWSDCSVTCGRGTQTRTAYCPDVTLEKCYNLAKGAVQTKACVLPRCRGAQCRRRCYNKGTCVGNNRCVCPQGYFGRSCQKVECYPSCDNGGKCLRPNKCSCPQGWAGKYCERAVCTPACRNGGYCLHPGVCSCPQGYLPPDCTAFCSTECYNGGTCIGFNLCKCIRGYAGHLCQDAICSGGCGQGGQCIAPNTCQCAAGWTGKQCNIPVCSPGCQNGGTCVLPYYCLCPQGTYGAFCERSICTPPCLNGGSCTGYNTCTCTQGYTGAYCQHAGCSIQGCYNNGDCVDDRCLCAGEFTGEQCQHRKCVTNSYHQPVYVRFEQPVFYTEKYACGMWTKQICSRTRMSYKTMYKRQYRHRCM